LQFTDERTTYNQQVDYLVIKWSLVLIRSKRFDSIFYHSLVISSSWITINWIFLVK